MRIQQRTSFLQDLLADVSTGKILPAAMQRPYVWLKDDVEALCDSIMSRFPIGSFLLWAPGNKADLSRISKSRLGPTQKACPNVEGHPYQLLLDGQNRLATLAWMLQDTFDLALPGASAAERTTWLGKERLVLDFATRSVKFVPVAEADTGLRLPAWTMLGSTSNGLYSNAMKLLRLKSRGAWLDEFGEQPVEEFLRFWDHACHQFREARIVQTVIEEATAEQARHAFLRICRVGVPMSQEDFDHAMAWTV